MKAKADTQAPFQITRMTLSATERKAKRKLSTASSRDVGQKIGIFDSHFRSTMADISTGSENVYLFIPNLIGMPMLIASMDWSLTSTGYSRIVLALISLYYMPWHPKVCTVLYSVSCLLDAFDGAAARKFNQSTKFGAVLDMVTDRCTTGCLLCFLSSAYPQYTFIFQLLITIDLASHYIHMYSTLNQGVSSHKKIPADQHWLLRLYYGNNVIQNWILVIHLT